MPFPSKSFRLNSKIHLKMGQILKLKIEDKSFVIKGILIYKNCRGLPKIHTRERATLSLYYQSFSLSDIEYATDY